MAILNVDRLDQYLKLNYNVLFSGRHGVGKTAIVKETFEKAGLKWKYFSCSTLDPWVDLVGVPKVIDSPGRPPYLDLVRPLFIQDDQVEAFFFR
jgi:predicted ATPase